MDGIRQRDLYDVLGVTPEASEDAIRRAYRTLALRYHPDLHPGAADDEFRRVAAAYRVLGDRRRRRAYDRDRRGPARSAGPSAQRRAPAPTGSAGRPRPAEAEAPPPPSSPPTDEWRVLSWVGGAVLAAALVAAIVVVAAALVLGGDHALLTLPGGSTGQLCPTPDGWVDCRVLDPSVP